MATPGGRPENLIPANERTEDELREMTRNGGIKSGEVRREKKRMSDIYAAILVKKYKVKDDDGKEIEVDGSDMIGQVIERIVQKGDPASVSMIRELRETLDGTKVKNEVTGNGGGPIELNHHGISKQSMEEFDAHIAEFYPNIASQKKTDE